MVVVVMSKILLWFLSKKEYSTSVSFLYDCMTSLQRLSAQEVIELGPLQMESLFVPLEKMLNDIRGSLVDQLEYVKNDFVNTIRDIALQDLYDTLDVANRFDLLDVIDEDLEHFSVLSNNYKLLVDALAHYNKHVVWLDNVFVSRQLHKNKHLN